MWGITPYGTNRRSRSFLADPETFFHDVDRVFDGFFGTLSGMRGVEMYEADGAVHLSLEVPGVDPSKVELRVFKDKVVIRSAEEEGAAPAQEDGKTYYCRRCSRRINYEVSLPFEVDPEKAQASFAHGVVEITAPRAGTDGGRVLKLDSGQ